MSRLFRGLEHYYVQRVGSLGKLDSFLECFMALFFEVIISQTQSMQALKESDQVAEKVNSILVDIVAVDSKSFNRPPGDNPHAKSA